VALSSKIDFDYWPSSAGQDAAGMRREWEFRRFMKARDFDGMHDIFVLWTVKRAVPARRVGVYPTAKWSMRLEHGPITNNRLNRQVDLLRSDTGAPGLKLCNSLLQIKRKSCVPFEMDHVLIGPLKIITF
jgi:hypothetical protein